MVSQFQENVILNYQCCQDNKVYFKYKGYGQGHKVIDIDICCKGFMRGVMT